MTFNTCYLDTGMFGCYAVADDQNLDALLECMLRHLDRFADEVGDDELARAKTLLKGNVLMQLDGFAGVCEDIGRQILTFGRRMPPEEVEARIDACTVDDIRRTAQWLIKGRPVAMAAMGKIDTLPFIDRCRPEYGQDK
jgi:processing peptidase subunit beta